MQAVRRSMSLVRIYTWTLNEDKSQTQSEFCVHGKILTGGREVYDKKFGRGLEGFGGKFRNIPLGGKIMIIFIAGIIVPFLVISVVVFGIIYRDTMDSENNLRRMNLRNAISSVEDLMGDYEDAMEAVYDNGAFFKQAAAVENISVDTMDVDGSVRMLLSDIRRSREFVAGVSFIFPDETYVIQTSGYGRFEEIAKDHRQRSDEIRDQMYGGMRPVFWQLSMSDRKEKNGGAVFFSGRKVIRNIYDNNEMVGMVVMHISTIVLNKLTALENYGDNEIFAVLDNKYQMIWSNGNVAPVAGMLEKNGGKAPEVNTPGLSVYEDYYFICQSSADTGWYFINMIPKAEVNRQANVFICFFMIVICLIIFCGIFCMHLVQRSIIYPIRRLIVVMEEVDDLDKIRVNLTVTQNDEIGSLYKTYNRLNQRIDMLVSRLTEMMVQDKEKEIKLMHSQLNPHFIYNTLESISWVAYEHQVPEVSRVVSCLSEILKYSIKFSDEDVTFGTEIKMLKNYLYIQHFRFEEKFHEVYEVDEALFKYKTIKFTFQPFVENALVHGFKNMTKQGLIVIRLSDADDDVAVEIEDNGCGMDTVTVQQAQEMHTKGIGIGNVDRALGLRFGAAYHIEISSAPDEGTKISFRVPKMK